MTRPQKNHLSDACSIPSPLYYIETDMGTLDTTSYETSLSLRVVGGSGLVWWRVWFGLVEAHGMPPGELAAQHHLASLAPSYTSPPLALSICLYDTPTEDLGS